VPNDKLLKIAPRDLPLELAFRLADDVLRQGIQGISQLVTQPGMINVDFSHVRNMLINGGGALMAIGYGEGQNRTMQALKQAMNHPLLESISLQDATGIIANFSGGDDLAFVEVAEALTYLHNHTTLDTEIIPGINCSTTLRKRVEVILVITGLGGQAIDQRTKNTVSSAINPASGKNQTQSATRKIQKETPRPNQEEPVIEFAGSFSDFDVPAFLRRKTNLS
jgi:cell division protein FtsZ